MKYSALLLGVVLALCWASGQAKNGHNHHKRNRHHREHVSHIFAGQKQLSSQIGTNTLFFLRTSFFWLKPLKEIEMATNKITIFFIFGAI